MGAAASVHSRSWLCPKPNVRHFRKACFQSGIGAYTLAELPCYAKIKSARQGVGGTQSPTEPRTRRRPWLPWLVALVRGFEPERLCRVLRQTSRRGKPARREVQRPSH